MICWKCNHKNRDGTLICEQCGTPISDGVAKATSTKQVENSSNDGDAVTKDQIGTDRFGRRLAVFMHISGAIVPITLNKEWDIVIGRTDSSSVFTPDIDLARFKAHELGVSRNHAALKLNDNKLMLTDLRSGNGTYLNGARLIPNKPALIRDHDEVRFGDLVARIYFG